MLQKQHLLRPSASFLLSLPWAAPLCWLPARASWLHAELREAYLLPLPARPGPALALSPHHRLQVEAAMVVGCSQSEDHDVGLACAFPRLERGGQEGSLRGAGAHAGWPMACNLILCRHVPSTPARARRSCSITLAAPLVLRLTTPLALRTTAGVLRS